MTKFALTSTAAVLLAGTASAQMFGPTYGSDLDRGMFDEGFAQTGYYGALDRNDDTMLDQSEYARGLYADFDRDNDLQISEDEYTLGTQRYRGADYEMSPFADYDADQSGFLTQEEFGGLYDSGYNDDFVSFDGDGDGMLTSQEYSAGMYDRADLDRNQMISIEEEGFFEGWFDGDDIEAEIESVGDVY